ncbi:Bug family tripartite tricarboxylate transporter substrate binding protein [Variovorax sp. PBL-E5]|uniref:Bug family tripartite tricarboxylate transporter substrate binding protein n=1 Tax=Variovorax sp. PBL-E5 TaxID=434014 RepID=UPI001316B3B6|nr:tripartite tricarboxylate transporter substrate-binding protein [Variovorax sp. PBL-E5]VTU39793.1 Argininosuccinate lyase [Variovorax sp. PBL-E5]
MPSLKKRALLIAACGLTLGAAPLAALAQAPAWPTKPVRLLVGFPAGSTPDMAARAISDPLARALGQPVIVENRSGASGNIATDQVAKATDDHTLGIVINGNLTSAKMLYPHLPYNPARDFSYISLIATAPLVLVAPPTEPGGAAFFAAAKKGGDKWNYGSVGVGSVGHLGMELLKTRMPGVQAEHIPFQGNPGVVTALLGGQIQMALVPPGLAISQVNAGKLKAIGLTSGRSPLAPEVPPLADAGLKNFDLEVWTALIGPARLSKAAQARLAAVMPEVMRNADTRRQLFNQGWQAVGTSAEGLKSRVAAETAIMQSIISAKGIKLQ